MDWEQTPEGDRRRPNDNLDEACATNGHPQQRGDAPMRVPRCRAMQGRIYDTRTRGIVHHSVLRITALLLAQARVSRWRGGKSVGKG